VLPQDVLDIAVDVLSHRLVLSYDAVADGVPAAHAVRRVLQTIPLPQVAPRQRSAGPVVPPPVPPGMAPQGPPPAAPNQPPLVYGQAAPPQAAPWTERTA
jgi:MoxR-like ATPase